MVMGFNKLQIFVGQDDGTDTVAWRIKIMCYLKYNIKYLIAIMIYCACKKCTEVLTNIVANIQ